MSALPSSPIWRKPLQLFRQALRSAGFEIVRTGYADPAPTDADPKFQALIEDVRPFSMATKHRMAAMVDAVRYVTLAKIPGAIVECGVWRGANMMLAARILTDLGSTERDLYLYDTFEGMSPPTAEDKDYNGIPAEVQLSREEKGTGVWCEASIQDVQANMSATGYPAALLHYVKGMVEDTVPATLPGRIALLRLDTDWYASTKHELEHLYPLLEPGGVLLIDDYGHWQGSRQAVDEYFAKAGIVPLLTRVDSTCRCFVKPR